MLLNKIMEKQFGAKLNTNKAISSNYYLNDIDATPIVKII